MRLALAFLAGAILVTVPLVLGVFDSPPERLLRFRVPENTSVLLTKKNELSGEVRHVPLKVSPGDVVALDVEPGAEAISLDEIFNSVIKTSKNAQTKGDGNPVIDTDAGTIEILKHDQVPYRRSRLHFRWEDPAHPVLRRLRRREKLDDVIAGRETEIDRFMALLNWTRGQWEPGTPSPYPAWNAEVILREIRAKRTGGFCGQYAHVLGQSLLSLGQQMRYIGLKEHFALEVWSNELTKWIALDPFFGVVFKHGGELLSSHDVYAIVTGLPAAGARTVADLVIHDTRAGRDLAADDKRRAAIVRAYSEFTLLLQNDHLTSDRSASHDVANQWRHSVVPVDKNFAARTFAGSRRPMPVGALADMYFPLNGVEIRVEKAAGRELKLRFLSNCPHGKDTYLVSEGGTEGGSEFMERAPLFMWRLNAGVNSLRVRAINKLGVQGPVATLEVKFAPNEK
jgi:hypothetical protein